jgi:hypothetical protein
MALIALPTYQPSCQTLPDGRVQVWDAWRRQWVAALPEEFVRQRLLAWICGTPEAGPGVGTGTAAGLGVPSAMIGVEREIRVGGLRRRPDAVVFGRRGQPVLVAECKAESEPLTQATLAQICQYNLVLGAPWLVVTNGRQTLSLWRNPNTGKYESRPPLAWPSLAEA